MSRGVRLGKLLILALTLALAAAGGALLLWSCFMAYDDEGYVLYSLRAFAEKGRLYDEVYSQYGPFFFVAYRALHALGLEFTNGNARGITLLCWVGTAALCGAIVWRESRGQCLATVAVIAAVFVHLWRMIAEPSHPGGFIALAVATAAWIGPGSRRSLRRGAALGALAAMLALTKVNVGGFLLIAIGAWWALDHPGPTPRRRIAIAAALAALPALVMARLLPQPWVWQFALTAGFAAAAAAFSLQTGSGEAEPPSRRRWSGAFGGALLAAGVTLGVVLHAGTTPRALLEGVLLGPLRHPATYSLPFDWRPGSMLLLAGSAAAWAWACRASRPRRIPLVMTGRALAVLGYAAAATGQWSCEPQTLALSYGLAVVWLFVIPLSDEETTLRARGWLALLLSAQALHAYPVAGSQVGWGTFLWAPLAALSLVDLPFGSVRPQFVRAAQALTAAVTAFALGNIGNVGWRHWQTGDAMAVGGAETIRPPAAFSSAIRVMVKNSQAHASTLFTLPGMMSFNLWSDVPPPTAANATHWFNLLPLASQAAIQETLSHAPRGALIVQRGVYDHLERQGLVAATPLLQWLMRNYEKKFAVESYEFWARKDRAIAAFSGAQHFRGGSGAATRHLLQICLAPDNPAHVATVELARCDETIAKPDVVFPTQPARLVVTPITESGAAEGPAVEVSLPFTLRQRCQLHVFTDFLPPDLPLERTLVLFRDAYGRKVAEARFVQ